MPMLRRHCNAPSSPCACPSICLCFHLCASSYPCLDVFCQTRGHWCGNTWKHTRAAEIRFAGTKCISGATPVEEVYAVSSLYPLPCFSFSRSLSFLWSLCLCSLYLCLWESTRKRRSLGGDRGHPNVQSVLGYNFSVWPNTHIFSRKGEKKYKILLQLNYTTTQCPLVAIAATVWDNAKQWRVRTCKRTRFGRLPYFSGKKSRCGRPFRSTDERVFGWLKKF